MSRENLIFKNSVILSIQHIIINLITIFIVGYIAKKLGKDDYGIYSLALAFPAIFEFIGSIGLRPLTIREISRNKERANEYLGKMIPLRVILIILMALTMVGTSIAFKYEIRIIYAISISVCSAIFEQFSKIILDVFQAFEEMGKVAIRDIIVRVFTAVSSIYVLISGYGLFSVCTVYVIGSLLGLLINLYFYKKRFVFPKLKFDLEFIKDNISEGKSYIVIAFATALYPKVDVLILSKMVDNTSLGIYSASANLFYKLGFMSDAIATAVFPSLSELYFSDKKQANFIFNRALSMMMILSFPIAIGGYVLSDQIIALIYGEGYVETTKVFSILVLSVPFLFLNNLFYSSLGAARKQGFVAKVTLINVTVGIVGNILFINLFGYVGAALLTVVNKIISFFIFFLGSLRYYRYEFKIKSIIKIIFSLFIVTLVIYFISPYGIILTIISSVITYFLLLKLLGQLNDLTGVKISAK